MAPPSSSNPSVSPSLPPHRSHLFTPIQEGNETDETEERHRLGSSSATSTPATTETVTIHHHPTPLHEPGKKSTPTAGKSRRRPEYSPSGNTTTTNNKTVSCNNCRPTTRGEKTSMVVVPVENHHRSFSLSSPSPTNGLFKSLLAGISHRKSPKPPEYSSPAKSTSSCSAEEQWRNTVAELSHKLIQATRKRDEAILESSRLKHSMGELEKKLNRLEVYCHNLKSGLESCGGFNQSPSLSLNPSPNHARSSPLIFSRQLRVADNSSSNNNNNNNNKQEVIIKCFLVSVSEARSSIRFLSKALTSQLKLMGVKVLERVSMVLRSYDIKISSSNNSNNNTRSLQFYLEALLSAAFYEDFETAGFSKNSANRVLNPIERSELNYADYKGLKDLCWEEVLSKGTKHFSEEFSKFCDRKMSEIVAMLGWNRAWPEQLLQAFFGASKSVWLVHLLANSVHPTLMIFRVEKGSKFDPVYMEDMGADKAKKLVPTLVKIMVTPGFYVYDNVVKCKVLCRYYNSTSNYSVFSGNGDDNRIALSPP